MEKKEVDIELALLAAPTESDLSMGEQMKNKKTYEKQVDTLCIQADKLTQENKYEDALVKLIEAYKIVSTHPWSIKQGQIFNLIQNVQHQRQEYNKKEQLRLQQLKEKQRDEEKQQALIKAHQEQLDKQQREKEEKLKQLQELKQREETISTQAFNVLEEGKEFLKNNQYDEAITKYYEAKNLFLEIKWNGEAKKIEDSIQEFSKQKQLLAEKQEKEKTIREEKEKEWKLKEQQLTRQKIQETHFTDDKTKGFAESSSRKILESQIYAKLDEAAKYEKSGENKKAVSCYEDGKKLMEKLGWTREISKLNESINLLLKKIKTQEDLHKRELFTKQIQEQEQQELEKKIKLQQEEQQKRETERLIKLQQLEEKKALEQAISEKAFQQIDVIEKKVKYYKEHAKVDQFGIECPYLQAKQVYENSRDLFLSIGWRGESEKLNAAISMYETLYQQDLKERAIHNIKQEQEIAEKEALEETLRLQKEEHEKHERERKEKIKVQKRVKARESEISQQAFRDIEEVEKTVQFYKENVIPMNYQLECPFLFARDVYKNSRNLLLKIGWTEEADKLLASISMYQNLHLKDQEERATILLKTKKSEIEQQELEKSIRLQKAEKEKEEKLRLLKVEAKEKQREHEEQLSKQAFERIEKIEEEVKYYRDHAVTEKYQLMCPYLRAKEIYEHSRADLLNLGWKEEADKLLNSISQYEKLYQKDLIERQKVDLLKKKQEEEEKQLQETIKLQQLEKEKQEQERLYLLKEQDKKRQEEEQKSKEIFDKIDEIEKEVKYYKEHVVSEEYKLECPFLKAKQIYELSRNQLLAIGWKKEADKLQNSISMYENLAQNDEKEREKYRRKRQKEEEERKKLEETIRLQKEAEEQKERERLRLLREQNIQQQHETEVSEKAFQKIEQIEKDVTYYKERVKVENYDLPCPYQRAKEVYQQAREMLLGIGWKKEADKLLNSISMYTKLEKEDLEIRDNYRKRIEKQKKEEEELQDTIRKERERLMQEEHARQSELAQKDLKRKENEELQQLAYIKLEEGNRYIQEKDFNSAAERLNEALSIFKRIKWKNGVRLTEDAIKYNENEQEKFEKLLKYERLALQEQKRKEREFQEFIEEQRRQKEQEEQNRKLELLRMEMEGKQIDEKQERAFKKLEEGNDLVKIREFDKANLLYLEALTIFQEIGWIDGVEKTKEAMSHNKMEKDRHNQYLELQKKQEKEKEQEEQELRELIRQRQALVQLEEEQKRLKLTQQHELAEKIKTRQHEAMNLLEEGNLLIKQHRFEEANTNFLHAMNMFKDIKWDHGIKITNEVMKHNAEERLRYEQLKQREENERLEKERQQKELEKMLIEQKILTEKETKEKALLQDEEAEKMSQNLSLQEEAMKYLEQGNHEISNRHFDQARKLFSISMKIFQDMGWKKGVEMVNSALDYNEKQLVKYNNEKLREEQKKKEAALRQHEINQLIQESKEEEVKKQLEWKQKLEEKTRRLEEENQTKDQIFKLLEQGSKLAAKNEFLTAIEYYKKTIPLFEKIDWPLKRDQVIDLIDTTLQDYESYRTHIAKEETLRKKQIQEEEELKRLIVEEREKEEERQKLLEQKQLEQMEQDRLNEELRQEAAEELNKAAVMLERRKFENALDSLNIALENFIKLGWTKEAQVTEEQIEEVQKQQREAYKPVDREKTASDMEVSEKGYAQIDEADKLIRRKNYHEAIPYLEEAKRLFEKIQWTKAVKMVELRIRETIKLSKEKEELIEKLRARKSRKTEKEAYRLLEKVDKFRRESHYDYALTSAKEAQKIFIELEWEREANDLIPLIETIQKEIDQQHETRKLDQSVREEKIRLEEEEERKIQEIIEERRRRRRQAREKLKED